MIDIEDCRTLKKCIPVISALNSLLISLMLFMQQL